MCALSLLLLGRIYPEFQVLLRICKNTVRARIPARERIYPTLHGTRDKVDLSSVVCIINFYIYYTPFILRLGFNREFRFKKGFNIDIDQWDKNHVPKS